MLDKIQDYFDGGAQLVWYIVPKGQKIYAYTSPGESTVFERQQTITAAPVLPDFQFTVADLFARSRSRTVPDHVLRHLLIKHP